MYKKSILLIVALMIISVIPCFGQDGEDPGFPDTLYVDSVFAYTSGIGVVPIRFYNDEALFSVEVDLIYSSDDVVVDSVSFIGSRIETSDFNEVSIDTLDRIITITSIFLGDSIPPGDGLFGNIYFSFEPGITPQVVEIDSITYTLTSIDHTTTFITNSIPGIPFQPQFEKGFLDIQEDPPTLDSLWVVDTKADRGNSVGVEVHLFNERDLQEVSVVLDYFSDSLLHFDSVSYIGSRSLTASTKSVQKSSLNHTFWVHLQYLETNPLTDSTGLLFTAFFTADGEVDDTTLVIDTATFAQTASTYLRLTPAYGGAEIIPLFNPGEVTITTVTSVEDITDPHNLPTSFSLAQNYPNPFNPTTYIEFSLPRNSNVRLDIYNILGRKVTQLINEPLSAGTHRVSFNGQNYASGVYFYRLNIDDFVATKKMILLK